MIAGIWMHRAVGIGTPGGGGGRCGGRGGERGGRFGSAVIAPPPPTTTPWPPPPDGPAGRSSSPAAAAAEDAAGLIELERALRPRLLGCLPEPAAGLPAAWHCPALRGCRLSDERGQLDGKGRRQRGQLEERRERTRARALRPLPLPSSSPHRAAHRPPTSGRCLPAACPRRLPWRPPALQTGVGVRGAARDAHVLHTRRPRRQQNTPR